MFIPLYQNHELHDRTELAMQLRKILCKNRRVNIIADTAMIYGDLRHRQGAQNRVIICIQSSVRCRCGGLIYKCVETKRAAGVALRCNISEGMNFTRLAAFLQKALQTFADIVDKFST